MGYIMGYVILRSLQYIWYVCNIYLHSIYDMFLNIRYLSIFVDDYFVSQMLTVYYRFRVHRSYHNGEDLENITFS